MALSFILPTGQALALEFESSIVATDIVDAGTEAAGDADEGSIVEDTDSDIDDNSDIDGSSVSEAAALEDFCDWCDDYCYEYYCDCDEFFVEMPPYITISATGFTGTWDDYDFSKAVEIRSETFLDVSTEELLMWYDYEVEGTDELLWEIAPSFMAAPAGYEYSSGLVVYSWFNPDTNILDVEVLFFPPNSLTAWVDFYTLDEDGEIDDFIEMEMLTDLSYWAAPGQRATITVEMIQEQLNDGLNEHRPRGYAEGVLYETDYITPDGEAFAIVVFAPLDDSCPPGGGNGSSSQQTGNGSGTDGSAPSENGRPVAGPKTGDTDNSFMQIAVLAALVATLASAGLLRMRKEEAKP